MRLPASGRQIVSTLMTGLPLQIRLPVREIGIRPLVSPEEFPGELLAAADENAVTKLASGEMKSGPPWAPAASEAATPATGLRNAPSPILFLRRCLSAPPQVLHVQNTDWPQH